MGTLQLDQPSWEVSYNFNMIKVFAFSCLLVAASAAPAAEAEAKAVADADAEADPYYFATAYQHTAPAPKCKTDHEVLKTQSCVPFTENICATKTVETEEIVANPFAAVPAVAPHHIPAPVAHVPAPVVAHAPVVAVIAAPVAPLPVAHAVAHSVTTKVKHACREVATEHCVNNPKVKLVPVEVENCHVVTKVKCSDVDNKIPKTTCEPVESVHVQHATHVVSAHHTHLAHKHKAYGVTGY